MTTFNIADVTDFLTPASVFTREDGREARMLFLTNTALPEKLRAKFPPQVVYADENDNVLSCDIERFLDTRKFFNVDPELEARLNNLLAASSTDSGEDILDLMTSDDDDSLVMTDEGDDDNGSDDDDSLELSAQIDAAALDIDIESIDDQSPIVTFTATGADLAPIFDPEVLAAAVTSYQQQPSWDLTAVQHVLFIKAEPGINALTLSQAFSPVNEGRNQTLEFAVDADGTGVMQNINWDTFIGVYPCVFYGSRMFQVVFSVANVPAGAAEIIAEAAPAVANDVAAALEQNAVAVGVAAALAHAAVLGDTPAVVIANPEAVVQVAAVTTPQTIQVKVAAAPAAGTAMQQAMVAAKTGPQ